MTENPGMSSPIPFALRGEFIELDKLLKATALTGSGGEARHFIS